MIKKLITLLIVLACTVSFSLEATNRKPPVKEVVMTASYYAYNFNGRKTANGEKFNMNSMTAAHRNLPFGTIIKVTNVNNAKSVIVRINDRGPYKKGRQIDLSKRAAERIEMTEVGVTKVTVKILKLGNI